jgi:hypothetical protein
MVAGSRSPVTVLSRFRSSIAVSESNPISLNGRPGSTAAADAYPSTAAACELASPASS